jgi:hypothetical protein
MTAGSNMAWCTAAVDCHNREVTRLEFGLRAGEGSGAQARRGLSR